MNLFNALNMEHIKNQLSGQSNKPEPLFYQVTNSPVVITLFSMLSLQKRRAGIFWEP